MASENVFGQKQIKEFLSKSVFETKMASKNVFGQKKIKKKIKNICPKVFSRQKWLLRNVFGQKIN